MPAPSNDHMVLVMTALIDSQQALNYAQYVVNTMADNPAYTDYQRLVAAQNLVAATASKAAAKTAVNTAVADY